MGFYAENFLQRKGFSFANTFIESASKFYCFTPKFSFDFDSDSYASSI